MPRLTAMLAAIVSIGAVGASPCAARQGVVPAATDRPSVAAAGRSAEPRDPDAVRASEPEQAARATPDGHSDASPNALTKQASESFQEGVRLEGQATGTGAASFLRAAALYQRLMDEHGVENHALHANRGAALLLAGDTGRAIAAFRRAERLDPTDAAVRQGLATARARVGASFAPAPEEQARGVLLAWRGYVPRWSLLATAVAGWSIAWAAAAVGVARARSVGRWIIAGVLAGVVGAAPLAAEAVLAAQPAGVVTSTGVVGLNGPGVGVYQPTFESPLPAGVEFTILERRDGWVRARLGDSRETWLPEDAIEEIWNASR